MIEVGDSIAISDTLNASESLGRGSQIGNHRFDGLKKSEKGQNTEQNMLAVEVECPENDSYNTVSDRQTQS